MQKFQLSRRSIKCLEDVHPDLRLVVIRAIQITEVDFAVVQGKRSIEDQGKLYGKGRTAVQLAKAGVPKIYADPAAKKVTWTMDSKHVLGRAVDLAPYVAGKLDWDNNGDKGLWSEVSRAMFAAAKELHVNIEWGGNWGADKLDRPHFQLAGSV